MASEIVAMEPRLVRAKRILGLRPTELASILDVEEQTLDELHRWSAAARQRLSTLDVLVERIEQTFESSSIEPWLSAPNRDLGWRTPLKALLERRLDDVDAALEALDSGVYV